MPPAPAAILPVFTLILCGWVAARRGWLRTGAADILSAFVVRLALPALLFQFVAEAAWRTLWQPGFVLAMGGGGAITFAVTFLLAGARRGIAERGIDSLIASYANTAFLGIPIAQALFGATGLAAAVIASLLTVCLLFAIAILIVEVDLHRGRGVGRAALGVAGSLACNPLVIAPVAGAAWALGGLGLPDPIHRLTSLLGAAASPVALVAIGCFLADARGAAGSRRVLPLAAMKLVGQPLVTFALMRLLAVPGDWGRAAILIAALPTGTGPFMLATLYKSEPHLAARVILITTLISALTIPLLAILLA